MGRMKAQKMLIEEALEDRSVLLEFACACYMLDMLAYDLIEGDDEDIRVLLDEVLENAMAHLGPAMKAWPALVPQIAGYITLVAFDLGLLIENSGHGRWRVFKNDELEAT